MTAQQRLIATARAEIGYLEKASNAQLDDKTANAGDRNWCSGSNDYSCYCYWRAHHGSSTLCCRDSRI